MEICCQFETDERTINKGYKKKHMKGPYYAPAYPNSSQISQYEV